MQIAVIIPVYRQAQYLIDSVTSALTQTLVDTKIVIVNDGCPDQTSHQLGCAFANAHPERVAYIRQINRGLSGARNTGIRRAIARWPDIDAIFPLDADNILLPAALAKLADVLSHDDRLGWVYPAMTMFGARTEVWSPPAPANLFLMLWQNQCDAGSLIRRRVFEDGIFYDETMRSGYEDWEFFVRALRGGWQGDFAGECGFLYRTRAQSMHTEAQKQHEHIVAELHRRHGDLLTPRELSEVEHVHAPRFLWVSPDGEMVHGFTDPDRNMSRWKPSFSGRGYLPPVLIVGSQQTWSFLKHNRLLRGILLHCQDSARGDIGALRFSQDGSSLCIRPEIDNADPHILCLSSEKLHSLRKSLPELGARSVDLSLRGSSSSRYRLMFREDENIDVPPPMTPLDRRSGFSAIGEIYRASERASRSAPTTLRRIMWERQCVRLETTYPLGPTRQAQICIAAPWLRLGGVDHCVIQLSRALRRVNPDIRLHLLLTKDGADCGASNLDAFDEITLIHQMTEERQEQFCDVLFQSMDLVLNAHSGASYESLKWRLKRPKSRRHGLHISYLHVYDQSGGRLVGYPYIAAELEHALDGFLVISDEMKAFLVSHGVSADRIKLGRNAPVVMPASREAAMQIASQKAEEFKNGKRPLRLLFAGRNTEQKGLPRLRRCAEILASADLDFELALVTDNPASTEAGGWPVEVRHLPATHDSALLGRYYADADISVLLSRWEGVPLALLDAMAHGCVPLATDVGAVGELVNHNVNGFLIRDGDDSSVGEEAAAIIHRVIADKNGMDAMRKAGVRAAFGYSWDDTARQTLAFLPMFQSDSLLRKV